MNVFHIVRPIDWPPESDEYVHESLASEGFIHCSYEEQLPGVIERYYADDEQLVIVEIDPSQLTSTMKVEPSTGGELYPHIYGPINVDACMGILIYEKGSGIK